jgi:hypothetical protein
MENEPSASREAFEKWYDASIWPGVYGYGYVSLWQAWKAAIRTTEITSLQARENEILREALEWYANRENYVIHKNNALPPICRDTGKRAFNILQSCKHSLESDRDRKNENKTRK